MRDPSSLLSSDADAGDRRRAREEQLIAAERRAAGVRAAVIAFNVLVYFLLMDHQGTRPVLAGALAVVGIVYATIVLALDEVREQQAQVTGLTTTLLDGSLIAAWIVATGGWDSPFYVLWYVSIVGVAFRYSTNETVVAATLYSLAYTAIGLFDVGVPDPATVGIRLVYIAFVGGIAINISEEVTEQTRERVHVERLAEEARQAQERFRRLLEAAPDAILIVDETGEVVLANERAVDLFDLEAEELEGRPVADLVDGVGISSSNGHGSEETPVQAEACTTEGERVPVEVTRAPLDLGEERL